MKISSIAGLIISFLAYAFVQSVLLHNFVAFDYAFCFIYVSFIISLPFETPKPLMLAIAFILGLIIDSYQDTLGLNMFSGVLIAYLRSYIMKLIVPSGGYDTGMKPSIKIMGMGWFIKYSLSLYTIHAIVTLQLEAFQLNDFHLILLQGIVSAIFTFSVGFILQFIFYTSSISR